MARTRRFSASTSIASVLAPRARARAVSSRIRAEPIPRPWRLSATTTPMSVTCAPDGAVASTAMACPTIAPASVATRASVRSPSPASRRSVAVPTEGPPVKNRR